MLLPVLALCLGLASGGRLGDCLLPKPAADATAPSADLPVPEGAPAVPLPVPVPSAVPLPVPVPSAVPEGAPVVPLPVPFPGPAAGPGIHPPPQDTRRVSVTSLPVSGSVSVGSFSSASSFQGPQAGFFQFSSPSAAAQPGFGGPQFSVPVAVCLNWCLSPTGSYVCCRYAGGQCPRLPEVCQANSEQVRLPTCANDNHCAFGFKCCFDPCHELFVCKAAVV